MGVATNVTWVNRPKHGSGLTRDVASHDATATRNGAANGSKYVTVNGNGRSAIYWTTWNELTRYGLWPVARLAIDDADAGPATDADAGPATDAYVGPATDAHARPATNGLCSATRYDAATKRYKCCQQCRSRSSSTNHGLPWCHLGSS